MGSDTKQDRLIKENWLRMEKSENESKDASAEVKACIGELKKFQTH